MKKTLSYEEWESEGIKRYGKDKRAWKFKCPSCGFIQTFNDFLKYINKDKAQGLIGFSCIGRVTEDSKGEYLKNKKQPCNYAGGGLFRLNPIIITKEGTEQTYFDFADSLQEELSSSDGRRKK